MKMTIVEVRNMIHSVLTDYSNYIGVESQNFYIDHYSSDLTLDEVGFPFVAVMSARLPDGEHRAKRGAVAISIFVKIENKREDASDKSLLIAERVERIVSQKIAKTLPFFDFEILPAIYHKEMNAMISRVGFSTHQIKSGAEELPVL